MEVNSRITFAPAVFGQISRNRDTASSERETIAHSAPRYTREEMQALTERLMKGTPVEDLIALDSSQLKFSDASPEELKAFNAERAANEKAKADQAAWEKENTSHESNEIYFSNVAVMDLDAARNEANVVKIFMENGMLEGRHLNAFNGDQKTSSPQEYLSWIYQRIEVLEG